MNIQKILVGASVTAVMLSSMIVPAFAAPANFGGNGKAWTNDYGNHYVNNNNPDVRMDWDCHRKAVPGNGGVNANPNSAVVDWSFVDSDPSDGGETLVVPHDNLTTCP
ncbi:hypothetical protein HYT02_04395 [Candidatus Gottesmanbacteria bacterium]|nr:hypothetical protein [Candidatus Gottesmanbacteria bacterium]